MDLWRFFLQGDITSENPFLPGGLASQEMWVWQQSQRDSEKVVKENVRQGERPGCKKRFWRKLPAQYDKGKQNMEDFETKKIRPQVFPPIQNP